MDVSLLQQIIELAYEVEAPVHHMLIAEDRENRRRAIVAIAKIVVLLAERLDKLEGDDESDGE